MSKALVNIACIAVLSLGACAPAIERIALPNDALPPASPPIPKVGQVFVVCKGENSAETCDQLKVTIVNVAADGCVTTNQEGNRFTYCPQDGPFFLARRWEGPSHGKGERTWIQKKGPLWPLEVGRHYSFDESATTDREGNWSTYGSLKVTGIERVTVPAGTFDTYRIEISRGSNHYLQMNYAPELGVSVFFHNRSYRSGDKKPLYLMEIISPTS